MKNPSLFPHEIKYCDIVREFKEYYQQCVDAINHSNLKFLYKSYVTMMCFETLANVYFHSSIIAELEMGDEIIGIQDEIDNLEVDYKGDMVC